MMDDTLKRPSMQKSKVHYTIVAPMKSPAAFKKMQKLLSYHYRTFDELFGGKHIMGWTTDHIYDSNLSNHYYIEGSGDSTKLRYQFNYIGDNKLDLGFEVHEQELHRLETEYIKAVVFWMSATAGAKRKIKGWGWPLKYYRLDGKKRILDDQDFGWVGDNPDKWPVSSFTNFSRRKLDVISKELDRLGDIFEDI